MTNTTYRFLFRSVSSSAYEWKTTLQVSKLKSPKANLYVERLAVVPLYHHSKTRKAQSTLSPPSMQLRKKPQPQLKHTPLNNRARESCKTKIGIFTEVCKIVWSSVALSKQVEVQREAAPHNCCPEYSPQRITTPPLVAAAASHVWIDFAFSVSVLIFLVSPFRCSPLVSLTNGVI